MNTYPVIEVTNLGKKYQIGLRHSHDSLRDKAGNLVRRLLSREQKLTERSFWALRDINFSVNQGEVVGIIGENGAGKSTLLKILSGIVAPTTGQIIIRGKTASLLEIGTGFNGELTGRENIYLSGMILGMKRSEIQKKFEQIVDFSGVKRFIDTPVKRYSSGMQARLAFSVSAHLDADILFLDEILSVGDLDFQRKSMQKMMELTKREDRTVLLVSHNLAAIQNLCGRTFLLKNGRLEAVGKTSEVSSEYVTEVLSKPATDSISQVAEDKKESGTKKVAPTKTHQGSGEIIVTNIKMPTKIVCGQNLDLVVELFSKKAQKNSIYLVLGLNDLASQSRVLYLSSRALGKEITVTTKRETVKFVIARLPLPPGTYTINSWLETTDGLLLDWVIDFVTFVVLPGDYYGSGNVPAVGQSLALTPFQISS